MNQNPIHNPFITIIIPVFNAEKYIGQCISSVINQEFQDFEIILVNDGSSDGSSTICLEYAQNDKRIKYIEINNSGASHARNVGLDKASGEYIWFVDADDFIAPDFLNQLQIYKPTDLTFFGYISIKDNKETIHRITDSARYFFNRSEIDEELTKLFESKSLFFGFTWNKIFKREIIQKYNIRFKENLIIKEDEIFTLEYSLNIESLSLLPLTPYFYRFLATSISHKKNRKMNMMGLISCLDNEISWRNKYPLLQNSFKRAEFNYYIMALYENKDISKFREVNKELWTFIKENHKILRIKPKMRLFLNIPSSKIKSYIIHKYISC